MHRTAAFCCLLAIGASAQEVIALRSGNGVSGGPDAQVTCLQGPFAAPFGVVEYSAGPAAPPAEIIPAGSFGWAPNLSNDPAAQWIAVSQAGNGPPSLYTIPFTVMSTVIGSATLTINMHVDDFLGDTLNMGISLNALQVPGSTTSLGGTWVTEVGFTNLDVTNFVLSGANYLYLYVNNTGATGPGGIQFRVDIAIYPPPQYQTNSLAAGMNVNGVLGTAYVPATVTLNVGASANLTLVSTGAGQPWDVGSGAAPLIPVSAGALLSVGGQIVNLDLLDPSLSLWFNFLQGPGFPPTIFTVLPFSAPVPVSVSAQFVVANPGTPSGLSLSQPTRLVIQ